MRLFVLGTLFAGLLLGTACSGNKPSEEETSESSTSVSEQTSKATPASDTTTLPVDSLSQKQRQRLGPTLRQFLTGDSTAVQKVQPVGERDGEKIYSVLIRSQNPEALREAGIPLNSVVGETITARLTIEEILTAASTDGVDSIRTDKQLDPHQ